MDKAYIHASICTSVQVAELSVSGQLIFERMFPHADFQGRLAGHPRKIKATVVPMIDISVAEIEAQLQRMHDLGLIFWYEAGGEKVIQLMSWWKYQDRRFAHPSKYPAPEGWKDRLRYNDPRTHVLIEENWEGVFGVHRSGKASTGSPAQDAYTGDLHRPPTQEGETNPSASASSSASSSEDQKQHPCGPATETAADPPPGSGGNGKTPFNADEWNPYKVSPDKLMTPDAMVGVWNDFVTWALEKNGKCKTPPVRELEPDRKKKCLARIKSLKLTNKKYWDALNAMHADDWASGRAPSKGHPNWVADFDWVIDKDKNLLRLLEKGDAEAAT